MKVSKILERELKEAGKELLLISEGKIVAQDYHEYRAEIKAKHGGKRAGAGKKSELQEMYPNEVKEKATLRIYPTQLKEIEQQYGSLQAAVDSLVKTKRSKPLRRVVPVVPEGANRNCK